MLRMTRALAASLTLLAAAGPLAAQQLASRPVPSVGIESFTFMSPSMGVKFAVNVGLPVGYKAGDTKKYQALISTDGDWAFGGVYDGARSLMTQQVIDGMFVVSIGTGAEDGEEEWTRRRIYEFSPPDWDRKDVFGVGVTGYCERLKAAPGKCTGGAGPFLNAIVKELIPLVAARYPIDTNQLGLFGISAGGFFATWTIFQPNSPFKKYIISSPAMAYGDGTALRLEEAWARDHKDLPVGIYFGAGVIEAGDGYLEGVGKIVSGMSHISGMLGGRNYPGLKLVTEYHAGMSHGDVMSTVVVRGLRTLYGKATEPAFGIKR